MDPPSRSAILHMADVAALVVMYRNGRVAYQIEVPTPVVRRMLQDLADHFSAMTTTPPPRGRSAHPLPKVRHPPDP